MHHIQVDSHSPKPLPRRTVRSALERVSCRPTDDNLFTLVNRALYLRMQESSAICFTSVANTTIRKSKASGEVEKYCWSSWWIQEKTASFFPCKDSETSLRWHLFYRTGLAAQILEAKEKARSNLEIEDEEVGNVMGNIKKRKQEQKERPSSSKKRRYVGCPWLWFWTLNLIPTIGLDPSQVQVQVQVRAQVRAVIPAAAAHLQVAVPDDLKCETHYLPILKDWDITSVCNHL